MRGRIQAHIQLRSKSLRNTLKETIVSSFYSTRTLPWPSLSYHNQRAIWNVHIVVLSNMIRCVIKSRKLRLWRIRASISNLLLQSSRYCTKLPRSYALCFLPTSLFARYWSCFNWKSNWFRRTFSWSALYSFTFHWRHTMASSILRSQASIT